MGHRGSRLSPEFSLRCVALRLGVGDPITLMDSDPLITFMKVIVTFYPLLWIRLLVSFIAIYGYGLRDCKSKYTPT